MTNDDNTISMNNNVPYDRELMKEQNKDVICSCVIPSLQMRLPDHIGSILANMMTPLSVFSSCGIYVHSVINPCSGHFKFAPQQGIREYLSWTVISNRYRYETDYTTCQAKRSDIIPSFSSTSTTSLTLKISPPLELNVDSDRYMWYEYPKQIVAVSIGWRNPEDM